MARLGLVLVFAVLLPAAAAAQQTRPRVIDGQTLEVGGTVVRLFGIWAPECDQTCRVPQGRWSCGEFSTAALHDLIRNRAVSCAQVDSGRYATVTVARCTAGGRDLGAALVAGGWALAQHGAAPDYVALEAKARKSGAGVWRGDTGAAGYVPY
ncbi:MAG: thermonuclease family protein [Alphaproteobacteria bacterium]|nr:thermonuclease family protein [Alphaproteobacteria bacterium]